MTSKYLYCLRKLSEPIEREQDAGVPIQTAVQENVLHQGNESIKR